MLPNQIKGKFISYPGLLKQYTNFLMKVYPLSFVYPLAFLNNLQTYVETGSRQSIDLNGASTGGGQYNTISNWLVDLASSQLFPSVGDLGHAFDNKQIFGKTWHIEVDRKVKASVITTHISLSLDKNGKLQKSKNLKPVQWYEDTSVIKNIRDAEDPLFLKLDKEHYNSLFHVI